MFKYIQAAFNDVDSMCELWDGWLTANSRFLMEIGRCLLSAMALFVIFYGVSHVHYLTLEEIAAMRKAGQRYVNEQSVWPQVERAVK